VPQIVNIYFHYFASDNATAVSLRVIAQKLFCDFMEQLFLSFGHSCGKPIAASAHA
jgi:hypothetical protein